MICCYFALTNKRDMTTILTITGSDGTGGSGLQQDIRTITALGSYAVSAITSITMQNTLGIQDFHDLPADTVRGQIEAIINDVQPDTVKIGMVRTPETLGVIVDLLTKYRPRHVVYDPVVTASNGERLMGDGLLVSIRQRLIPLCTVVVTRRYGQAFELRNGEVFGVRVVNFDNTAHHGLANSFSSALAVYLSRGATVDEAARQAQEYISTLIARSSGLKGRGSILYNDFLQLLNKHYRTNRDVAFYAERLNVTPRYLAQVTHNICDRSPKALIDQMLIDAITAELDTTRHTIQEIAFQFGFYSQAQLSTFYKKQTGQAPSERRRKPEEVIRS